MNLPPTLRKLARRGVTFSRALLKDGNLLSRPQPEAVLAPVSYRSSRRRRRRKRLLLKVPIAETETTSSPGSSRFPIWRQQDRGINATRRAGRVLMGLNYRIF